MRNDEIKMGVFEILNSNAALSAEQAKALFAVAAENLSGKGILILDFAHMDLVLPNFLEAFCKLLSGNFEENFIKSHLRLQNLVLSNIDILKIILSKASDNLLKHITVDTQEQGLRIVHNLDLL